MLSNCTVYIFYFIIIAEGLLSKQMDKRMVELLEAFQHLKFEECLRMSDQIIKKMDKSDNKKKSAMSEQDIENLYLTRVGSLAATAHLHEANELINSKFTAPVVNEKSSFLFLQIGMMALDKRISGHVTAIVDSKEKKNIDINRFILMIRKFSVLARIFLKKFAVEKKNADSFAQIYLQYLQQLENQRMISYHRDNIIVENKASDFKFVSLFLDKFVVTFKAVQMPKQKQQCNNHIKILRSIIDLKIKIAIRQGKAEVVRNLLQEHEAQLKDNAFVYYRSLAKMCSDQQLNSIAFIRWYLDLFRRNLDMDRYQPVYDFSIEFVIHLVDKSKQTLSNLMLDYKPTMLPAAELYGYRQSPKDQLWNYIDSLYSDYGLLRQKSTAQKKKDYYKIALKNCMLVLSYVLVHGNKIQQSHTILLQYKEEYGKKLTFVDEIWDYIRKQSIGTQQFLDQLVSNPSQLEGAEDKLIWLINRERLTSKNPVELSSEQNLQEWHRLYELYSSNLIDVEHEKKLEKGERYLSDQFLSIMTDSIRKYTELANASERELEQLHIMALTLLEAAIKRSPYNHDLKIRAIYFYNWLNYHEESFKILESLDIKAVQFETLGYLYLRDLISFGVWDSNQQLLVRMVRSYQETYKESIEYAYKALISTSFNECEENLCYNEHIQNSYNFLVLMYVLYLKNRSKPNCEFYLHFIRDKLAALPDNKITLSCDGRVLANACDRNFPEFVDFYGIYNNPHALLAEVQIKLLMINLASSKPEQQIDQLRKGIKLEEDIKSVYCFEKFHIFDRSIDYQFSDGKMRHERRTEVQLRVVNKINMIKLSVCDFLINSRKEGNIGTNNEESIQLLIKQLCQILNSLSWRQQTHLLPQVRTHVVDAIVLLSAEVDALSAKKKKVEGQAQKKQACQQIIASLVEAMTQHVKLQPRIEIDKKFANESFWHRDELLERVTKMTSNQYKKAFKLKG